MTASGQSFTHYVGTTRRILIPLKYASGVPFDQSVTSAEWICGKSNRVTKDQASIVKTLIGGGLSVSEESGVPVLAIDLAPTDTSPAMEPGTYYHEARIGWGGGKFTVVATGNMELKRRILP